MSKAELLKLYFDMREIEERLATLGQDMTRSGQFVGHIWETRGREVSSAGIILKGWRILFEPLVFEEVADG